MSKKKQRGNRDKSKDKDKNKAPAGHSPAGQTAARPTAQTPTRPPLARVPRSRPMPVDSMQVDRPGPDSEPYAGAAERLSVYSEWLNSPPPEIPAWLTGASEPMAAVRAAPAAADPAPATPQRGRKPTARRKNASAAARDGAVLLERTATASLDLGAAPENPALPRTRTRRSSAARRLTAAQRAAMETISTPTATAPTATPRDSAQMRVASAPVAARKIPAEQVAATIADARQAPAPSSIEVWRTARTSSRARAARASATPPAPTVAPVAVPAAPPPAPAPTPGRANRAAAPAAPTTHAAAASASGMPSADAATTHDAADDWLLSSGVGPAIAREPSSRASAFLTAEPPSPVLSAFAALTNASGSGKGSEAGRPNPPTTLGQTASRVAIPRSPSGSPSLPAAPAATGGRLPAVQQSRPTDIATAAATNGVTQPPASAVLIHGARHPQPTSPVVPRRNKPRSPLAQVVVAVFCVVVLFAALTITSPLGYGAALTGTFQAYANSVAWIPTATPTPKPPVYVVNSGGDNIAPPSPAQQVVINEIVAVFGTYANGALGVARCESGYDASARNPYAVGNSHAEGVFQILYPSTWDTTSYAGDNPYDYVANIHAAFQIFQRDGYSWREWQCQP